MNKNLDNALTKQLYKIKIDDISDEEAVIQISHFIVRVIKEANSIDVETNLNKLFNYLPADRKLHILNSRWWTSPLSKGHVIFGNFSNDSCLFEAIAGLWQTFYDRNTNTYSFNPIPARTAVRMLLENGANPNLRPPHYNGTLKWSSMLGFACALGDLPVVKMLLDAGAEINPEHNEGKPGYPFFISTLIQVMFSYQKEKEYYKNGPINDKKEIFDLLYERGLNTCEANFNGQSHKKNVKNLFVAVLYDYVYEMTHNHHDNNTAYFLKEREALVYALPILLNKCRDMIKYDATNPKIVKEVNELFKIYPEYPQELKTQLIELQKLYNNVINDDTVSDEKYVEINDVIPTDLEDIIAADFDLNETSCKERGFIVAMKTNEGFVYECISKQNLVYYNTDRRHRPNITPRDIIMLHFKNKLYKVELPNWLKQQDFLNILNMNDVDNFEIPQPKIFLLETSPKNRDLKVLLKAQFVNNKPVEPSVDPSNPPQGFSDTVSSNHVPLQTGPMTRKRRREETTGGKKRHIKKTKRSSKHKNKKSKNTHKTRKMRN